MSLIIILFPIVEGVTVIPEVLSQVDAKTKRDQIVHRIQMPWKCSFPMDNHWSSSSHHL